MKVAENCQNAEIKKGWDRMDALDIEWRQKITCRLMQGDLLRKAGDTTVLR